MTRPRITLLAAIALLAALPALAQQTAAVTASATVPASMRIALSSNVVTFAIDANAFDAGFAAGSTSTMISHRANVRHSVSVASNAATFTATNSTSSTDPVRADKPSTDLQWSQDAFGTAGFGLNTTAENVVTNAARGRYDNAVTINWRMLLDWADDTPGDYSLGVTFTIGAS